MVAGTFPVISSEFTYSPAAAIERDSMRRFWNCFTTFNAAHAGMFD
jgi:hypothetical protein